MSGDVISALIPLFVAVVWSLVVIVIVLVFRKGLKALLTRVSTAGELSVSLGSLTLQSKAMHELRHSITQGFPGGTLKKAEVEALIDTKIKSVQAAIDHALTGSDMRSHDRNVRHEMIKITTQSGEVFDGETLDVSAAGIAFKSSARLRLMETVTISPGDAQKVFPDPVLGQLRIVRIELSKEGQKNIRFF